MSVKNIVRNLFVSGALVLSGGVACSRPTLADTLEQLRDFNKRLYRENVCYLREEHCILNVLKDGLKKGNLPDSNSLYVNANDMMACLSLKQKCMDKVNEAYPMNIDDVDVHTFD